MSASHDAEKLRTKFEEMEDAWLRGESTSPSINDYVIVADEELGLVFSPRQVDDMYESLCDGCSLQTLAEIMVETEV